MIVSDDAKLASVYRIYALKRGAISRLSMVRVRHDTTSRALGVAESGLRGHSSTGPYVGVYPRRLWAAKEAAPAGIISQLQSGLLEWGRVLARAKAHGDGEKAERSGHIVEWYRRELAAFRKRWTRAYQRHHAVETGPSSLRLRMDVRRRDSAPAQ
jgi:hypothetical protein